MSHEASLSLPSVRAILLRILLVKRDSPAIRVMTPRMRIIHPLTRVGHGFSLRFRIKLLDQLQINVEHLLLFVKTKKLCKCSNAMIYTGSLRIF